MALALAKLADGLESAWAMPADLDEAAKLTESGQIEKVADAVEAYLGDATVLLTGSSVTFPAFATFKSSFKPAGTAPTTALAMETALVAAMIGALGKIDGIPAPPGTSIVSEIATPPIPGICNIALLAAFTNNEGTLRGQAEAVAGAIHGLVMTIFFIVIQLVPSPAGPVPVPIPAVPIL